MSPNPFAAREAEKKTRAAIPSSTSNHAGTTPQAPELPSTQSGLETSLSSAPPTIQPILEVTQQTPAYTASASYAPATSLAPAHLVAEEKENKTVSRTFLFPESLDQQITAAQQAGNFRSRNAFVIAVLKQHFNNV
jgi:hypothetical protein